MKFHKIVFLFAVVTTIISTISYAFAMEQASPWNRIIAPLQKLEQKADAGMFTKADAIKLLQIARDLRAAIFNNELGLTDTICYNMPDESKRIGSELTRIAMKFRAGPNEMTFTKFGYKVTVTGLVVFHDDAQLSCLMDTTMCLFATIGAMLVNSPSDCDGMRHFPQETSRCADNDSPKEYCLRFCDEYLKIYEKLGKKQSTCGFCTKFAVVAASLVATLAVYFAL